MSRSRVIVVIFSVTAFLIFTILIRTSSSRLFNQYRQAAVEQKALRQQLWQSQLRFECLVNPAGLPVPAPASADGGAP
ncbi:MAG: hypothetical protein LLF76_04115 [Planctomycetaceae bacterium]|nr:hypothetical protein [Planctomycetaceae bacterium]